MSGRTLATTTTGLMIAVGTVTLGACAAGGTPSPVVAGPHAGDPACVRALAAAPATLAGLGRTPLQVQGALSWGEPAVILRCGLPEQPPTTKPCLGVNGVDWILDVEGDPFVFVSYGRFPAVELRVPARYGRDDAVAAVTDAGPVASALPTTGRACVGPEDSRPSASP